MLSMVIIYASCNYFLLLQQFTSVPSPIVANMAAMIKGIVYILLLFLFLYRDYI
jgi:hypothetical protein